MKKFVFAFLSALLILCIPATNVCFAAAESPNMANEPAVLQNVIARLLTEDIYKAVSNYYSEYLVGPPQIETYAGKSSTKILSVVYETDTNLYVTEILVEPYVGAHNPIGQDIITFEIDGTGAAKVRKFEHIKSFEIVPWLKDNLKKRFPPDTY